MSAVHPYTHSDFGTPEDFPALQGQLHGCDAPPGRLAEVRELVAKGNREFRDNRVEKAITYYSKALVLKPGDHLILSNRSMAFSRISRLLRSRSASESEYRPLNGLDPTTHAELALKDAEKVIQRNSVKSCFLKADALVLLERYEEAKETLLSGLQIDPLSHPLQNALRDLEKVLGDSNKRPKHEKLQRSDDFECTLCFKLLYEPVTTPCGHCFCRTCLLQSLDHGNKCPMCRTILFISPRTYPISVTLNNIIQKNFPEEYAERKAEHASVTNIGVDILPLFVLDVVLPCQKLTLNIFEPRYRLMVRRIMEGNRRMGMVAYDSTTGHIADFACEVEITECEPIPDGRFYLEVIGRRRFQILRCRDQDGYRVAEVEWIEDSHLPEGSPEKEDLKKMAYSTADMVQNLIGHASEAARTDRRLMRLAEAEGMPSPRDPELFSFWLFNLLTLRPQERLELLRLTDTRERISRALIYLRLKNQGSGSNDKLRCQT